MKQICFYFQVHQPCRIAEYSFQYAKANGRKKATAMHKANIMKLSDGLFLECFYKVAEKYPEIEAYDKIIDNACMQLVMRPEQFDIVVMENLYGDIVSDLCAGLIGGLGLAPGANIGTEAATFEAVHGSAPDIAGKNIANPIGQIWSAAIMLEHLGEQAAADCIVRGIEVVTSSGNLTTDLGGTAKTSEIAQQVIDYIESQTV